MKGKGPRMKNFSDLLITFLCGAILNNPKVNVEITVVSNDQFVASLKSFSDKIHWKRTIVDPQ